MSAPAVRIQFEGVDPSDAGRFAQELREEILSAIPEARVSLEREDKDAQDLGSFIEMTLPIAGEVAKHIVSKAIAHLLMEVIEAWWERRGRPALRISVSEVAQVQVDAQSARPAESLAKIEKALTEE